MFACGSPDPPCNASAAEFPHPLTQASIAYEDGEIVNFSGSDGTAISTVVERFVEPFPDRANDCEATIVVRVEDIDGADSFLLETRLVGINNGNYFYTIRTRPGVEDDFSVNIRASSTIRPGEVDPSAFADQRIIADTILNGTAYREVVEENYPDRGRTTAVERVYWNQEFGFLQFVHRDGFVVWLEG